MPMNLGNGGLLDLSKMLDMKKQQQEAKKRKVEALLEKQRQLIVFNPLISKEKVENYQKEINSYKAKIS